MTVKLMDGFSATLLTTNNTQTTIWTSPTIPDKTIVQVKATINGLNFQTASEGTGAFNSVSYTGARRDDTTGAFALTGAAVTSPFLVQSGNLNTATVTFDVSGNTIRLRITGTSSAVSAKWFADIRMFQYTP